MLKRTGHAITNPAPRSITANTMKLGLGEELTKKGGISAVLDFQAAIDGSQTDATVIAAPVDTTERIRVMDLHVMADADTTLKFSSKVGSDAAVDLHGALAILEGGGYIREPAHGVFSCQRGAKLVCTTGTGAVKIYGTYIRLKNVG